MDIEENKEKKKTWSSPEFYLLNFKDTAGGNNPSTIEDASYDAYNELS